MINYSACPRTSLVRLHKIKPFLFPQRCCIIRSVKFVDPSETLNSVQYNIRKTLSVSDRAKYDPRFQLTSMVSSFWTFGRELVQHITVVSLLVAIAIVGLLKNFQRVSLCLHFTASMTFCCLPISLYSFESSSYMNICMHQISSCVCCVLMPIPVPLSINEAVNQVLSKVAAGCELSRDFFVLSFFLSFSSAGPRSVTKAYVNVFFKRRFTNSFSST